MVRIRNNNPTQGRLQPEFASVVITEKVSRSASAALSCQRSHKPAKPYGSPDFKAMANGCLVLALIFCHSRKASAGTGHRLFLNASRKEDAVATVLALALMVEIPIFGSFAQPQRIITISRPLSHAH
jgi:hypothetical protein